MQPEQFLSIIVAMDENRVIGYKNSLPWHLPEDLKRFKNITMGHAIIMGRATYNSIKRPLPGRKNIILTRDINLDIPGCYVVTSIKDALLAAQSAETAEIFIIGGASIYKQFLPHANKIYLSVIHHTFMGDTYFPEINAEQWKEEYKEFFPADANNLYAHSFIILKRIITQKDTI